MSDRREYHRLYKRRQRAMQKLGLKVIKPAEGNSLVMDSRQVAELVEKEHKNLMRDIRGYVEVLEMSSNLSPSKFFIPSTYTDSLNRDKPCYLLTKQGCEMVANKMTGEKGILFTATYVSRFNEMEQVLNQNVTKSVPTPRIQSDFEDIERDLKTAKATAEMMGDDRATLLQMIEAIYEKHGVPTEYLDVLKEGV